MRSLSLSERLLRIMLSNIKIRKVLNLYIVLMIYHSYPLFDSPHLGGFNNLIIIENNEK